MIVIRTSVIQQFLKNNVQKSIFQNIVKMSLNQQNYGSFEKALRL